MRALPIFLSLAAVIGGIVIFVGLGVGYFIGYYVATWIDALLGIALIAGGLTYLWKLSGFRGLSPK